jgi:hypothetical protein
LQHPRSSYLFFIHTVLTETGHVEHGKRLLNWVWYFVVPDGSPQMSEIFTDANGKAHPYTVPHGLINPKLWAAQIARYQDQMIPPIAEAVTKTSRPFVTKVGESQIQQASHFDNRRIVVGDAFTGLRSHMGMASEQAARHCWQMDRVWREEITQEDRNREATRYAERFLLINRLIGLTGLGHYLGVLKTLWALMVLSIRHKIA